MEIEKILQQPSTSSSFSAFRKYKNNNEKVEATNLHIESARKNLNFDHSTFEPDGAASSMVNRWKFSGNAQVGCHGLLSEMDGRRFGFYPKAKIMFLGGFREPKKKNLDRRPRTTFTQDQSEILENEYKINEYLNRNNRQKMADRLALSESQIKIWFQNRRAKDKRIEKAKTDQRYRCLAYNLSTAQAVMSVSPDIFLPVVSMPSFLKTLAESSS